MTTRLLLALLLVALGAARASTQGYTPGELPVDIPESLDEFWDRYSEAKAEDDEDDMDAAVRRYEDEAVRVLDLLLDATARYETPTLTGEARALAWSLDRVTRGERYIERTRYVLGLAPRDRGTRRAIWVRFDQAVEKGDAAVASGSQADYELALEELEGVAEAFLAIGDYESAMRVFLHGTWVTQRRGLDYRWERAGWLQRAAKTGEQLAYRDPLAIDAADALESLVQAGFDPNKPKSEAPQGGDDVGQIDRPKGPAGEDAAAPGESGTATLGAFAEGSRRVTVPLEHEVAKKGLDMASMPSFYPFGQFFVWPVTTIGGEGPDDFDNYRGAVVYKPFGEHWQLLRDGVATFMIDTDRDGEPEVRFTPSSSPSLVEVPGPEKGQVTPLQVSVGSTSDQVMGMNLNLAPSPAWARLRFQPSGYLEGKVEGERVKLFDLNMDAAWGPVREFYGDVITEPSDEIPVSWWEPDGILIGRDDVAQPLSSVMKIGRSWYRVEVDSNNLSISTQELDLPTGEVKLDYDIEVMPEHLVAMEVGDKLDNAVFNLIPSRRGGTVELPAGEYKLVMGLVADGRKTSMDVARIYTGRSPSFTVKKGETTTLELGAPYDVIFEHEQDGEDRVLRALTLRVFGRFGEEYAAFFDEPLHPEVSVRQVGGITLEEDDPMRLPSIEDWQKASDASRVVHFPVDWRMENPKDEPVEIKVLQEEHGLLGGPLESEWIP